MNETRMPGWARGGWVLILALSIGCVGQRDELENSERQKLEANLTESVGTGEAREGAWPRGGAGFEVHLEATLACTGLVKKSQLVLARAWVSTDADPSALPVIHPRSLELQVSMLNGLFAGSVYTDVDRLPDHSVELTRALDGNVASSPCGCVVAAATAFGFPNFQSRLVAKRVICPEGMRYDPPASPN